MRSHFPSRAPDRDPDRAGTSTSGMARRAGRDAAPPAVRGAAARGDCGARAARAADAALGRVAQPGGGARGRLDDAPTGRTLTRHPRIRTIGEGGRRAEGIGTWAGARRGYRAVRRRADRGRGRCALAAGQRRMGELASCGSRLPLAARDPGGGRGGDAARLSAAGAEPGLGARARDRDHGGRIRAAPPGQPSGRVDRSREHRGGRAFSGRPLHTHRRALVAHRRTPGMELDARLRGRSAGEWPRPGRRAPDRARVVRPRHG